MLEKLNGYLVNDLGVQSNVAATFILILFVFSLGFIIILILLQVSKSKKKKNMVTQNNYKQFFDAYAKSSFQIQNDLRFWEHFLKTSIEKYQQENIGKGWISESGYSLYNSSRDGKDVWLYVNDFIHTVETEHLDKHRNSFFLWVMNMAIVRLYGSLEKVLILSIGEKHFPGLNSRHKGKRLTNAIVTAINANLKTNQVETNRINNRHIIAFLSLKTKDFKTFLSTPVNYVNWKTTRGNFFEMLSILRNVISHETMIISKETHNTIKSIPADIFDYFFEIESIDDNTGILKPKSEPIFLHFITLIDDFVANTIKFIAEEKSVAFLGFSKA